MFYRAKRGFTLLEILIVATLFTIIGAVVASLFTRGASTYKHGETHIEMQRNGRRIVARLTPYFNSAIKVGIPLGAPAIINPQAGEVTFSTTEDWFDPNYPSPTTSATLAPNVGALNEFYYRVRQDGTEGDIFLEKVTETLPSPSPPTRSFTTVDSLRILRQKKNERIKNLRFSLIGTGTLLLMEFETTKMTRGDDDDSAGAGEIRVEEKFRITYNLPKDD